MAWHLNRSEGSHKGKRNAKLKSARGEEEELGWEGTVGRRNIITPRGAKV